MFSAVKLYKEEAKREILLENENGKNNQVNLIML